MMDISVAIPTLLLTLGFTVILIAIVNYEDR
jgi:hypothetical protein